MRTRKRRPRTQAGRDGHTRKRRVVDNSILPALRRKEDPEFEPGTVIVSQSGEPVFVMMAKRTHRGTR